MAEIGTILSSTMQTPDDDERPKRSRRDRRNSEIIPGAPTHSKMMSGGAPVAGEGLADILLAGSMDGGRPEGRRGFRPRWRKFADDHVLARRPILQTRQRRADRARPP